MAKKLKFNYETLNFDEVRSSLFRLAQQGLLWLIGGALFLIGYYIIFSNFFSTPQEKQQIAINQTLSTNYELLQKRHILLQKVVSSLKQRDANIYYYIFEAEPPAVNLSGTSLNVANIEHLSNTNLTKQTKEGISKLTASIDEQTEHLKKIIEYAQSNPAPQNIPASQPVANPDLRHTAATYGMRIHPFYKVLKMHSGIDFATPLGEKVFATGNARVVSINNNLRNAGLSITLDHDNGYQTVYAHLLQVNVRMGEQVKRGSTIGLVGNSGRSMAPHLHYEIWKNGRTVNPLHYFFKDITPDEYQKLIAIAANKGQSLD
jgi:murein DD-endopeptidase MepM/ murein hydrolase activator NlpD